MGDEPLPVFVFGCVSCGKTVAGTEKACPRCGASFEEVRFECPFCGALISPRQHRCTECGTEFDQFAEDVADTSSIELDGSESPSGMTAQTAPPADKADEVSFECPNCGNPVSEKDVECPNCGVRFS